MRGQKHIDSTLSKGSRYADEAARFRLSDPAAAGLVPCGTDSAGYLFTLDAADEEAFLAAWAVDAAYMKAQPGFISTQLHRALGTSPAYLNTAVWETIEAFRTAFSDPAFQAKLADYPASAVAAPHLFERVAVPSICIE